MNGVCRNFSFNEKADGVLELIKLNCDECDVDKNECEIFKAYNYAKIYAASVRLEVRDGNDD